MSEQRATALIADDEPLLRDELAAMLARTCCCQGQRPSSSTCSAILRNVRMSTMSPRTRTFSSVGATTTVWMMSAATSSSRPSKMPRPTPWRSCR